MKQRLYIILIITILLTSCEVESEIEYPFKYAGDKLVVHALIEGKIKIEAYITKTVPPDKVNADNYVKNANVELFANDEYVCRLIEMDSSHFVTPDNINLKYDVAYRLKINGEDLKEATTNRQYLIKPVLIEKLYTVTDKSLFYYCEFFDSEQLNDNYYFRYFRYYNGINYSLESYHEIFNPYGLIPDKDFNGQKKIIIEEVPKKMYINGERLSPDSTQVYLYTISTDLAKFLQSIQDYEATQDDAWYEFPLPVFSNIENGYGIFASYSYDYRKI